jgi:predicted amidohydrolase YtcJ
MRATFLLFACVVLLGSCNSKQRADLVLHNGRVYTVDSSFRTVTAFAVKDGKIVATGTDEEIMNTYTCTNIIDAHGQAVYPGFIDAHAHFVGYGQSLFQVNLYDCKNWGEAVARVKTFTDEHPNETWIRGGGWDQNKWPTKDFPENTLLNQLFPDRPVMLERVDGHAVIANNKALELAGITADTKVAGGSVELKNGHVTGTLIDNAADLVRRILPAASKADYEKWLTAAQKNCFAQGLTTITDCGLMYYDVAMIDTLQREGKLKMRMYVMLSDDTANFNRYLKRKPYKTDRLFVKGIKAYADGALGSRGACLLAPYADKEGWNGFLLRPQSHYDSLAQLIAGTEYQLCTHAIGDSGNRMILNVYSKYLKPGNDRRWRIEHAQVVNEADFDLFGRASIIPSVQPTHATSDMYWAGDRLGTARLKNSYAYKKLLDQNGWIPLGTDFPVEDISPVKTFYAAVVRKDAKGFPADGFQKENALTREQAMRGITIWAAKADFLEQEVGSIEAGKKADFIIVDKDMMKVSEDQLLGTKVVATYLGGGKM